MGRRTIVLALVVASFLGALLAVWADGRSGGATPDTGWEEVLIVLLGFVAVPGMATLAASVARGFASRGWSRLAVSMSGFLTGAVLGFFAYALFVAGAAGVFQD
jgi:peptidoglycan biosynthesis protein MviN/MurJ (putative lipid II flippase)